VRRLKDWRSRIHIRSSESAHCSAQATMPAKYRTLVVGYTPKNESIPKTKHRISLKKTHI